MRAKGDPFGWGGSFQGLQKIIILPFLGKFTNFIEHQKEQQLLTVY